MAKKTTLGPDRQDILRAAYSMIANHGEQAAPIALARARNLGDNALEARDVWERIFRTLQQLQSGPARIAA
jgi:hypothetical protein